MWLLDLILLILLGVLGIASWLKGRQPKLGGQLGPLEGVAGWIGLVGLIWGIVMLLQWLQGLEAIRYFPGVMIVGLVMILVVVALSLILSMPVLRSLFGANNFTTKLAEFSGKLMPYKVGLGFACLVLAIYLLTTLSPRAF